MFGSQLCTGVGPGFEFQEQERSSARIKNTISYIIMKVASVLLTMLEFEVPIEPSFEVLQEYQYSLRNKIDEQ